MRRIAPYQNSGARDLAFLAMAVAVHAALLLLPLNAWKAAQLEPAERLTINLQALAKAADPKPDPPSVVQSLETSTPPLRPEVKYPAADIALEEIPPPQPELPVKTENTIDESPIELLNARQLHQLARQAELVTPKQESTRRLGSAKGYQPPANWNRNAGAAFFADFEDRSHIVTLPDEAEIVDRWQADDGSHNVIVNLPSGEALCGRAAAFNPMQPLVEPVMMFKLCSRTATFSMPDRYKKGP